VNSSKTNGDDVPPWPTFITSSVGWFGLDALVSLAVQLGPALIDHEVVLLMVFGGCCSNAWTYEQLLTTSPQIGSALTFFQMLFITLHTSPSFFAFQKSRWLPRLKPRQVPLIQWTLQVFLVTASSLLLNWAHAYKVPLTVLIVFRSAGLAISMLFGFLFLKKRYASIQISCVAVVSVGVVLATLSRSPSSSSARSSTLTAKSEDDSRQYLIGLYMIILSSISTGILGILQELTYKKYGPYWKEGVFYTHFLSLPIFVFLYKDVKAGITSLSLSDSGSFVTPFIILMGNLVSQLVCVSGVNRLNTQMTSVSTNLVLTARKALSLCLSVWWFGNGWNLQFGVGASMVFLGSIVFSVVGQKSKSKTS